MFTFTSLVPPEQLASALIRSALLTFENDIRILVDPGWDTKADLSYLESIITSIDLILLSHPSMAFLGAFAYLFKKNPTLRSIPVYSTAPVSNLGRVETIESYRASGIVGPVIDYQLEINDIEEAFDSIVPLKHNQSTTLRGKFDNLTITAINAGHSLGGIIWLFNKNSEKIIYAPAWNHSKDSYLEGAHLLQQENGNPLPMLARPLVFITSAMIGSSLSYNKRVEKFLSLVDATLQNSGTVLLPISLGSRLLELVHLVDDHLRSLPYQVYLLARTGTRALTYAGSMLEWMSPAVTKEWHSRGKVPFAASTVTIIDHVELERLQGSKVVFCCGAGLESGSPAFESFIRLCNDPTTTILLTEKAEKGTLAHDLYQYWEAAAAKRNNGKVEDGVAVPYQSNLQVDQIAEEYLLGKELENYQERVKQRREEEKQLKQKLAKKMRSASLVENEDELLKISNRDNILDDNDDDDDDEEEDEDVDDDDEGVNEEAHKRAKKAKKISKGKEENLKENLPLDIDVRNSKGKNRMFPYVPKRWKFDDYGEVINPKDFAKKDSKYDFPNNNNIHNNNHNNINFNNNNVNQNKIGEKRRFGQDSLSSKKVGFGDNGNGSINGYGHRGTGSNKKLKDKVAKTDEMTDLLPLSEPRRQVVKHLSILTKCGLVFVDLAGLVDLRSLSLIVPSLKPRKLLLLSDLTSAKNSSLVYNQLSAVNRSKSLATSSFGNRNGNCNGNGNGNSSNGNLFDLIEVQNNQEIDISDSVASFEIVLDDSLSSRLKWQKITGGFSIAQVIGTIVKRDEIENEEDDIGKKENKKLSEVEEDVKMKDEEDEEDEEKKSEKRDFSNESKVNENDGASRNNNNKKKNEKEIAAQISLVKEGVGLKAIAEDSSQMLSLRHTPLAIGDIKLKELKNIYSTNYNHLANNNNDFEEHTAEFKGEGTLVIDEKVCVRKISEGDFVVEGVPCKLFYEVRERVRNMLAYV